MSDVRRQAWVWPVRVVGLALLVGGTGLGTLSLLGGFFHRERAELVSVQEPVRRLVVTTDTGRVRVLLGSASEPVRVVQTLASAFGAAQVSRSLVAGTLRLQASCRGPWVFSGNCHSSLDVTVRPGTELDLRTSTGRVVVDGVDGDLRASTSTGSVQLDRLRSQRVVAQTATGAVRVDFARPPLDVRARTSTGSVRLTVPDDGTAYRVNTATSTGRAVVEVPRDDASQRTLDAATSVGSVRLETSAARGN